MEWADIIDGALYDSPQTAVEMNEPAMKLTMVIESNQQAGFIPRLIEMLAYQPLAEICRYAGVAERLPALMERHRKSIEIMRERTECNDGTVFFDVTDHELEGYNKFVPYYLNPEQHLQCGTEQEQLPDQGVGGIEPVGSGGAGGEPGEDLRALRRRRTRARGRDFAFLRGSSKWRGRRRRTLWRSCGRPTRSRWPGRDSPRRRRAHGETMIEKLPERFTDSLVHPTRGDIGLSGTQLSWFWLPPLRRLVSEHL